MGSADWILKGKKLITNTKKQRLKIKGRDQTLKNTILKKCKIYIKNVKFPLKIGYFFQVNSMF